MSPNEKGLGARIEVQRESQIKPPFVICVSKPTTEVRHLNNQQSAIFHNRRQLGHYAERVAQVFQYVFGFHVRKLRRRKWIREFVEIMNNFRLTARIKIDINETRLLQGPTHTI